MVCNEDLQPWYTEFKEHNDVHVRAMLYVTVVICLLWLIVNWSACKPVCTEQYNIMYHRPFPEMQAIARAHANLVQNKLLGASFHPHSFSNQCSHLIVQLSFPMFELLNVKYQGLSK